MKVYPGCIYQEDFKDGQLRSTTKMMNTVRKFMTCCNNGNTPDFEDLFILFIISFHDRNMVDCPKYKTDKSKKESANRYGQVLTCW